MEIIIQVLCVVRAFLGTSLIFVACRIHLCGDTTLLVTNEMRVICKRVEIGLVFKSEEGVRGRINVKRPVGRGKRVEIGLVFKSEEGVRGRINVKRPVGRGKACYRCLRCQRSEEPKGN